MNIALRADKLRPSGLRSRVLAALTAEPASVEALSGRTRLPIGQVRAALHRLAMVGLARGHHQRSTRAGNPGNLWSLPGDDDPEPDDLGPGPDDPTADDIRRACLAFQDGWQPGDARRKTGVVRARTLRSTGPTQVRGRED